MANVRANSQNEVPSPVSHHNDHEDIDLCSPFCQCSCCAGFSIIIAPTVIPLQAEFPTSRVFTSHLPEDVIEISLPVWQPPQLV